MTNPRRLPTACAGTHIQGSPPLRASSYEAASPLGVPPGQPLPAVGTDAFAHVAPFGAWPQALLTQKFITICMKIVSCAPGQVRHRCTAYSPKERIAGQDLKTHHSHPRTSLSHAASLSME